MKWVSRAAHEPLRDETLPAGKTSPHTAGSRVVVGAFLAGVMITGSLMWWRHAEQMVLVHGFAKKAGIMHVDPTGVEYWDESINGARGTRGMSTASR